MSAVRKLKPKPQPKVFHATMLVTRAEEWWVEAGSTYFDETVAGVQKASAEAADLIKARESKPYASGKR